MPKSKSGHNYILTVEDFFSKWPEAVPLKSKSASEVADALLNIFLRMGFPNIINSDQGREFVNSVMNFLAEKSGFSQRISTAYHPESQGLVER